MDTITIREATPNDLPGILSIINYNILHTTAVYDYEPKNMQYMETWLNEKQQAAFPVFLAHDVSGQITGYASYGNFKQKDGYRHTVEHSVYTAESYSGKGIGNLLMLALLQHAKSQHVHCMIGLIDADNHASIYFHKKHGFTEAGIIKQAGYKFNRWLDVLIMQVLL
ncbi:GNAT family N-acetyltransferase [Flavobacterium sp. MK4S-17]|uniref:GNAT family N-acetyltransferase n=1 Tax=Flavobacterium sp. MK4S-17 TaxID=2543737 RepID=UPI00135C8F18|nr:GNAT family N-acetyltransferase [Flavobacterium sp. MK4S-17]